MFKVTKMINQFIIHKNKSTVALINLMAEWSTWHLVNKQIQTDKKQGYSGQILRQLRESKKLNSPGCILYIHSKRTIRNPVNIPKVSAFWAGELLGTPCCQLNTEWELLFVKASSLSPIVGIPWLFSSNLSQCRNCLYANNPYGILKHLYILKTNGDAFHAQCTLACSARVWRSEDEPMYEIPAINGHAAWNDKALIPAQWVLSPRSWGSEFSQGFVCGSTDCTQTMNPLIELQTFQSLRGWVEVWFHLPNIWGYVSSKNTSEILGKYRMLLCFSN